MNDRPTLEDIRARCAEPVTEIVSNPREYLRVQTILRDRAELLRLLDELRATLERVRRLSLHAGDTEDTLDRIHTETVAALAGATLTTSERVKP